MLKKILSSEHKIKQNNIYLLEVKGATMHFLSLMQQYSIIIIVILSRTLWESEKYRIQEKWFVEKTTNKIKLFADSKKVDFDPFPTFPCYYFQKCD